MTGNELAKIAVDISYKIHCVWCGGNFGDTDREDDSVIFIILQIHKEHKTSL
jgi:hypothetical protein